MIRNKYRRATHEIPVFFILRCLKINNLCYHSLYSIIDFDLLIHLQITACKYRSAANNWCKYFIEHAHFENASSASIKKSFFQNVNMVRFAELSESELSTILEEKDAENTKKATKVTLNILRRSLDEKGLREAELLHQKLNSRMHVCQIKLYFFKTVIIYLLLIKIY